MDNVIDTNIAAAKNDSRFALTLKKYVIENWKMLVYGAGAILAFWAMIGVWVGWLETAGAEGGFMMYACISSILLTVMASLMFKDMNGKEKRISTLMCPASIADKFWVRFIFSIPVPMLIVFLGYFIFGWFRMLSTLAFYGYSKGLYLPTDMFANSQMICGVSLMIASFLLNLAIYNIGAICWPKYSFLKTTALQFGIQMIIFTIATILVNVDFILIAGVLLTDKDILIILWSMTAIITVLAIAGWWFTYYKFKTKTL